MSASSSSRLCSLLLKSLILLPAFLRIYLLYFVERRPEDFDLVRGELLFFLFIECLLHPGVRLHLFARLRFKQGADELV